MPAIVHAAVTGFPKLLADHAAGRGDAGLAPTVIQGVKQLMQSDGELVAAFETGIEQDVIVLGTANPESMGAVATEFAVFDGGGTGRHRGASTTPRRSGKSHSLWRKEHGENVSAIH